MPLAVVPQDPVYLYVASIRRDVQAMSLLGNTPQDVTRLAHSQRDDQSRLDLGTTLLGRLTRFVSTGEGLAMSDNLSSTE